MSRLRNALVGMSVIVGLLGGTAGSAMAATNPAQRATVAFGAGPSVASTSGQPCQSASGTCAGSDPHVTLAWSSAASTAGCQFRLGVNWGDGKPVQTVSLSGAAKATSWPVSHNYAGAVKARHAYPITVDATVVKDPQARGCSIESAAVTFALQCTDRQISGPSWSARFPGGISAVDALNDDFQPRVEAFVAALSKAGITVQPQSTMRSPQRSYLMHYSYLIAKKQIAPQDVPAYVPVAGEKGPRVCWAHQNSRGKVDKKASVAGAQSLLRSLGVDPSLRTAPALHSRHNTGDAIDMRIQWSARTVKVKDAAGNTVKITSSLRDGTNPKLIAVGATYGVNHFYPAAVDRNHWSKDGR